MEPTNTSSTSSSQSYLHFLALNATVLAVNLDSTLNTRLAQTLIDGVNKYQELSISFASYIWTMIRSSWGCPFIPIQMTLAQ